MNGENKIASWSKRRLVAQGLRCHPDTELAGHRFGNRFAYFTCMTLVVIGSAFKSQLFLLAAPALAFVGMFSPYHPVDYHYNFAVSHLIGREETGDHIRI